MRDSLVIVAVLMAMASASPAHAQEDAKLGIAVLNPTVSGGIAPDLPPVLAGILSTRLDQSGVFRVVSEDDVKRMVNFDQMKTALSCDDQASCLAEVGAALGVPWLLTSSVAQVGTTFIANLTLIDIENAKSVKRESATYTSLDALIAGLPQQVERTAATLLYREQGRLLVVANVEGAMVAVDGNVIGTTPLAERAIASGPHRITVSKDGFIQHAQDVVVRPKEQAVVDAKLRSTGQRAVSEERLTGIVRLENELAAAKKDYWAGTPWLLAGLGVGIAGLVGGVGYGVNEVIGGEAGYWTLVGCGIGAGATFFALELAAGITVLTNIGMEADIREKEAALEQFRQQAWWRDPDEDSIAYVPRAQ